MERVRFALLNRPADSGVKQDDTGVEFAGMTDVRKAAQHRLPDIAREEIPEDGDRQSVTVLVRDEDGHPAYTATSNDAGLWLLR
ncbi:DUF6894 family protein [Methylobacterium planeticum]|uniref:DUF6894 domain-containing protein n=1 Tax=Methylobacterium planeticum TaxID=2615211 RepID=A0A6N6MQ99_9HYPH|nr:hypothetical protein [Methylobacterium planeticum]KAB1073219.1 hypothetical protein F6X51_12810 [Methylobacterium planeticum]